MGMVAMPNKIKDLSEFIMLLHNLVHKKCAESSVFFKSKRLRAYVSVSKSFLFQLPNF